MNRLAARSTSIRKPATRTPQKENSALQPHLIHLDVHALFEVCRQVCLLHVSHDPM